MSMNDLKKMCDYFLCQAERFMKMRLLCHVLDENHHSSKNWRRLDKCNNIYLSHIRNHIKL